MDMDVMPSVPLPPHLQPPILSLGETDRRRQDDRVLPRSSSDRAQLSSTKVPTEC